MNAQDERGPGSNEQIICPGLYFCSTPDNGSDTLILLNEKKIRKESVTAIMEVVERNKSHYIPSLN